MKWKLLAVLTAVLFASPAFAEDPMPKPVAAPGIADGEIKLVDRDQLRVGAGTKRFSLDKKMRVALDASIQVPPSFDWTKGGKVSFPMMGNDRYGDCYMVALCKLFICMNANATGKDVLPDFPTDKVVKRYLQLSGGDNGLSDREIFPESKNGCLGPNGAHKVLDYAIVSSTDQTALGLCHYAFGPVMYTFSVPGSVMQNIKPGVLWDTQTGRYVGGHAVLLSGKKANGNYSLETWGLNPPVEVTPRFIAANDPECIATFSLEWFNAKGVAPNGQHYVTLAPLWESLTGGKLPASPFPPPDGPTPPIPPAPTPAGVIHFGMTDLTAESQGKLKAAGITTFDVQFGFGQPVVPPPPPVPMLDPYALDSYAAVMEKVRAKQTVYLTVGAAADPYAGSYSWHALLARVEGIDPGTYRCYLGTDGKPMMQKEAQPAPMNARPRAAGSSSAPACVGPDCPQSQPAFGGGWYPGKLIFGPK